MLDHIKRWWFAHLTWILAAYSFLSPSVAAWAGHHPGGFISIAAAWTLLGHALQSPLQSPPPQL